METPSFKEDHISQIPALQLLQNLGYTYLSQDEALSLRGGKTTAILLEKFLRDHLRMLTFVYREREYPFSEESITKAIQALKDVPMNEGYMAASARVYDLLTQGIAVEETVTGDKKSYTIQFINWKGKNSFHVTEEYGVMRTGSKDYYRPDIVLFINGIPLCIIENKRPDMKEPLKEAISQHIRNQQEDGIRSLYVYSQMVIALCTNEAKYATTATPEEFWGLWREKFLDKEEEKKYKANLFAVINASLTREQKDKLFADRFKYVRRYFDSLEAVDRLPTAQDECLYGICRPDRMLDLIHDFIVFEAGEKKIARYQQFFAIKKAMPRLMHLEGGKRRGGVIWHTQGSGKSLTMVMLAQAIAQTVHNPKIILVTDRVDLDDQLTGTFTKCNILTHNAKTGKKLIELLESKSEAVVTTIINKFESGINHAKRPFESSDIFVLVDEGHRSQYGDFNIKMMKTLPNACFIAMTGTPLLKKEKNTADKFGGMIDTYPIQQAEKDGAVVKLLYEGRHAQQHVDENAIDRNFQILSESLSDNEKKDLKKKFSRPSHLMKADHTIYEIAMNLSTHFRDNWQGTGFKGQLVCSDKETAIRYKQRLDEIGIVSSEVLISAPDDREGEETAFEKSEETVKRFWKRMMDEHGDQKKYESQIINRFKKQPHPEIIIVVDKLLTGFDAPVNTVMYITRSLKEHKLLQAIARVNRLHPGKSFGYIIDYYGVLTKLDDALDLYAEFADFDSKDIEGAITDISQEVKKLPQKHSVLWDIFKTIPNKKDEASFEEHLRDEAIRVIFYDKVADYAKCLKVALSSLEFQNTNNEAAIKRYKDDAKFFLSLRNSVRQRYSDAIDFSQYEMQIRKLIDRHIQTDEVKPITALVPIFDKDLFKQEVAKTEGDAAKADKIASRTAKHISEKMDEDPAFYKKFSALLKEAIQAYADGRLTEAQYLTSATALMNAVLSYTDDDIPEELRHRDVARAFFGLCSEMFDEKIQDKEVRKQIAIESALTIDNLMRKSVFDGDKPIIDWQEKSNITGGLQIDIGDYFLDEISDKYKMKLSFEEVERISGQCLDVAKVRYK